MAKTFLKAAVFFVLFGGLWYLVYPYYNMLIALVAYMLAPLYDSHDITHSIVASGNEITFTIRNVIPGLIEKSFSNNFNFAMLIFPPLLLSTVKKPPLVLARYLGIGLLVLAMWNTFFVISHMKLTYATELNKIGRARVEFSSKNYTATEVEIYKAMKKLAQHGTRVLPVLLWLFFLLLSKRPSKASISTIRLGKPGRNLPCPCGSGLKFKHCCGKKT